MAVRTAARVQQTPIATNCDYVCRETRALSFAPFSFNGPPRQPRQTCTKKGRLPSALDLPITLCQSIASESSESTFQDFPTINSDGRRWDVGCGMMWVARWGANTDHWIHYPSNRSRARESSFQRPQVPWRQKSPRNTLCRTTTHAVPTTVQRSSHNSTVNS